MNRRNFFKVVATPMVVSIGNYNFELKRPILRVKEPEVKGLLEPGIYKVQIVDVALQESKIRAGEINIHVLMRELDSKIHLHKYFSPRGPYEVAKFVNQFGIDQIHDSVDLSQAVGKVGVVQIEVFDFNNRKYNGIRII